MPARPPMTPSGADSNVSRRDLARATAALAAAALAILAGRSTRGQGPTGQQDATPAATAAPEPFRLVARVLPAEWAALPSGRATPESGDLLAGPSLVAALRAGGYVLSFRHARTDFSQPDTDRQNLGNCASQRNLSEEGRADARLIGEAIRALGIPIGEVLSSEYCRTRETAEIAFGRVTPTRDLTSRASTTSEAEEAERIASLRRLLAATPAPGTNTVLVGHLFNLRDATGVSIAEGEAAIFEPLSGPAATPSA